MTRGSYSREIRNLGSTPFLKTHKVERYRLDNGLRVLLVREDVAPVVSFQTWFEVGSSHERKGLTGIAHLFEHLMFKETRNTPEGQFSRILEEAGARDLNAWTWNDETVYIESVPVAHLELVMRLESDRMSNLLLNERQVEAEKDVVLNERRFRCEDAPYGRIEEALWAAAFIRHPYGWPGIGWREDIKAIGLEHCLDFYRSFYAPNNAILILVGDIKIDPTLDLIHKYYGHIPSQQIIRPAREEEPKQNGPRYLDLELSVESEILAMGIKAPGLAHPDRAALQILDLVLNQGKSSRLERKLVDAGLASSCTSDLPPLAETCLYELDVTLREGRNAEEAEDLILEELEHIAEHGISTAELDRAMVKFKTATFQDLRDASERAQFLGLYEIAAGRFEHGIEFLDGVDRVTPEDVSRAAATWLNANNATMLRVRPSKHSATHPSPLLEKDGWKTETVALDNDSTLHVVEDHSIPLTSFVVRFPGGMFLEPSHKEGLGAFVAELLTRGTKGRKRRVFEEALEDLGAELDISVGSEFIALSGTVLSDRWDALNELMEEMLTKPAFDTEEVNRLRSETLSSIQEMRNDDKELLEYWFARLMLPGHPYGRSLLGTAKTIPSLTKKDLRSYYKRAIHSSSISAGVAGDIRSSKAQESFSRLLKAVPAGETSEFESPPPTPRGHKLYLIDKPDRSQCQILLGHSGIPASDPDHALLKLGTTAFGGFAFSTRLMREIREKRSWSYGAYARTKAYRAGGLFSIWVFPDMQDAADCLALIYELHQQIQDKGLDAEELKYAKKSLLNGASFDEDTPERCLRSVMRQHWLGIDRRQILRKIEEASLEEVNRAIRRCYLPEHLSGVIVGTAPDLLEPLSNRCPELDLKVIAYDSDDSPQS